MKIERSVIKLGGLLALFALITTGLVATTYTLTKDRIAQQIQAQRLAILAAVIPNNLYDNQLSASCVRVEDPKLGGSQHVYIATNKGKPTAFAIETTAPDGYSGDINMIVGVDLTGNVLGVRVLKHKETPGLGDKIDLAVSDWILSFNNKHYSGDTHSQWHVKKDGGEFDQFTGATITPRAVVKSVANTLSWALSNAPALSSSNYHCEAQNNE